MVPNENVIRIAEDNKAVKLSLLQPRKNYLILRIVTNKHNLFLRDTSILSAFRRMKSQPNIIQSNLLRNSKQGLNGIKKMLLTVTEKLMEIVC